MMSVMAWWISLYSTSIPLALCSCYSRFLNSTILSNVSVTLLWLTFMPVEIKLFAILVQTAPFSLVPILCLYGSSVMISRKRSFSWSSFQEKSRLFGSTGIWKSCIHNKATKTDCFGALALGHLLFILHLRCVIQVLCCPLFRWRVFGIEMAMQREAMWIVSGPPRGTKVFNWQLWAECQQTNCRRNVATVRLGQFCSDIWNVMDNCAIWA